VIGKKGRWIVEETLTKEGRDRERKGENMRGLGATISISDEGGEKNRLNYRGIFRREKERPTDQGKGGPCNPPDWLESGAVTGLKSCKER